jgi:hypothetical protein
MTNGTRRGRGVSVTPRPFFTPGKDPVPILQEAWWAPGPVWTGSENLAPTGIRLPDRPACSQSLYRLSYPFYLCLVFYHTHPSFGLRYHAMKVFVFLIWLHRLTYWPERVVELHVICIRVWRRKCLILSCLKIFVSCTFCDTSLVVCVT